MDALETFLNKLIISNKLDSKFGLIQLLTIPKMCESHEGKTFMAFCRMEKPEYHGEVAKFFNFQEFEQRKINVSQNNLPTEMAKWYHSNNTFKVYNDKRMFYHEQKTEYMASQNTTVKKLQNSELMAMKDSFQREREGLHQVINENNKIIVELKTENGNLRAKLKQIGEANYQMEEALKFKNTKIKELEEKLEKLCLKQWRAEQVEN